MDSVKDRIFGQHQPDAEILRLEEIAHAQKNAPGPLVDLAIGYLSRIQIPPNWNQSTAQKAVNAFRRATSIAKKVAPAQVNSIIEIEYRALSDAALAYLAYHSEQPDLKWLEAAIWLLEHILTDVTEMPEWVAETRENLNSGWTLVATWHEGKLESETGGHERLKMLVNAGERALTFTDDQELRAVLDVALAATQIRIGSRYYDMARKSTVYGADGKLLKINDREHKGYASHAIRILHAGRHRLHQYPNSEDYTETMTTANMILAGAYFTLYELTWAHAKARQSIGILQKAVRAVPQDAHLWHGLGEAYEQLHDEYVDEATKSLNGGIGISNSLFGGVYGGGCAVALAKLPVTLRLKSIENKANECYSMERQLINSPSDPAAIPGENTPTFDSGEWLDYAKTAFSKVSVLVGLPLMALLNFGWNWANNPYQPLPWLALLLQLLSSLIFYSLILSAQELAWKPLLVVAGAIAIVDLIGNMGGFGAAIDLMEIVVTPICFLILAFAAKRILKGHLEQRDFKTIGIFTGVAAGLAFALGLFTFLRFGGFGNVSLFEIIIVPILKTALLAFLAGLLVPWLRERISHW